VEVQLLRDQVEVAERQASQERVNVNKERIDQQKAFEHIEISLKN